jgi:hypothetical protein
MDIYILKPLNLRNGNDRLFVEVNNRGNKLFSDLNRSSGGNNPTTAAHAGDAFLMNQGYSIAWNGWDFGAAAGNDRLTIKVGAPLKNPDGSTITGPSYEYIVFDNATTTQSVLAYPAATLDKSKPTLTVRDHLLQTPTVVPAAGWDYTTPAGTAIKLAGGAAFKQGAIYEFSYTAKDPVVAGLGLAATRDFIAFLRHAAADDYGNPNPLAHHVKQTYAFTVSQPARYLNDYETLGFNEDEAGRRVIDGILNWLGAGDGVAINFRFAQTGRTERNRQNHRYPEANFPFTFERLRDPFTGKVAGRGDRCRETNTCAKSLQANSSNEYWVKAGSLVHTTARGRELDEDPRNVRYYLLSGTEHTGGGAAPNSPGVCQQFRNTTNPAPALRALFVALDEWVREGRKPPKSQVPEEGERVYSIPVGNGVGVIPQKALGWPDIPGVNYSGLITVRHLFNFGPRFADGIMDLNPPDFSGPVYPSFVSKVDRDGNEIAGVRLPPVEAPIATTTGWGLRSAAFGGGPVPGADGRFDNTDGCESSGQWIAFKSTKAERLAADDPRRSLEERYKDHEGYVKEVGKAARKLENRLLLLQEDVQRYIDEAAASNVLR